MDAPNVLRSITVPPWSKAVGNGIRSVHSIKANAWANTFNGIQAEENVQTFFRNWTVVYAAVEAFHFFSSTLVLWKVRKEASQKMIKILWQGIEASISPSIGGILVNTENENEEASKAANTKENGSKNVLRNTLSQEKTITTWTKNNR